MSQRSDSNIGTGDDREENGCEHRLEAAEIGGCRGWKCYWFYWLSAHVIRFSLSLRNRRNIFPFLLPFFPLCFLSYDSRVLTGLLTRPAREEKGNAYAITGCQLRQEGNVRRQGARDLLGQLAARF